MDNRNEFDSFQTRPFTCKRKGQGRNADAGFESSFFAFIQKFSQFVVTLKMKNNTEKRCDAGPSCRPFSEKDLKGYSGIESHGEETGADWSYQVDNLVQIPNSK